MTIIAGHLFHSGRCSCGIAWVDIRNASQDDVGMEGVAHTGKLAPRELEEIQDERGLEDARIANAMGVVAVGAGR